MFAEQVETDASDPVAVRVSRVSVSWGFLNTCRRVEGNARDHTQEGKRSALEKPKGVWGDQAPRSGRYTFSQIYAESFGKYWNTVYWKTVVVYPRRESAFLRLLNDTGAPDIPALLLMAQKQNRLVLFCGAGVSSYSELPRHFGSFNALVRSLVKKLIPTYKKTHPLLDKSVLKKQFEQALQYLSDEIGGEVLKNEIEKLLTVQDDLSAEHHQTLLRLAKNPNNNLYRLVTTNFDAIWEKAHYILEHNSKEGMLAEHVAPALPVPKKGCWDSIVYIHGKVNTANSTLVYNTATFGQAYITERWASTFITELFMDCCYL